MAKKNEYVKNENIVLEPVVSEKSYALASSQNKYTFMTTSTIEKIEAAKELEKRYKVKVVNVNSVVKPGKMRIDWKTGNKFRRTDKKKIIFTLKKGDKIDEFFNL